MRNVMNSMRYLLLLLFLSSFLFSCENKMDEHYEKPEWLKGTAWEVLSNEYGGKFSMFLEAAELSGFKPILDGKSVATVMSPVRTTSMDLPPNIFTWLIFCLGVVTGI